MPRETVRDQSGLYDIQVGWGDGSDVQVGIESRSVRSLIDQFGVLEALQAAFDAGRSTAPDDDGKAQSIEGALAELLRIQDSLPQFTGLWGSFSRHDCNRLVELVRRARDKSYGKDA